jgi:hypothetical protein
MPFVEVAVEFSFCSLSRRAGSTLEWPRVALAVVAVGAVSDFWISLQGEPVCILTCSHFGS